MLLFGFFSLILLCAGKNLQIAQKDGQVMSSLGRDLRQKASSTWETERKTLLAHPHTQNWVIIFVFACSVPAGETRTAEDRDGVG